MRIKLNHWYVKGDELSIALMQFHVRISIGLDLDDSIFFVLTVNNSNMENIYLYFSSLEEAIDFTENTIDKCESLDEIKNIYKEQYQGKSK